MTERLSQLRAFFEAEFWASIPLISGAVVACQRLLDHDVFRNMVLAHEWLWNPYPALEGMTPNECARVDARRRTALDLPAGLKPGAPTGAGNQVKK